MTRTIERSVPEYAPMIFEYFRGSCPSGHLNPKFQPIFHTLPMFISLSNKMMRSR